MLTFDQIRGIISVLIQRDATADDINYWTGKRAEDLVYALLKSNDYYKIHKPGAFTNAASSFDLYDIIKKYELRSRTPSPGYLVNFMGVKYPIEVAPGLKKFDGAVGPIPIPDYLHADMAEWAAVLRAVELASGTFRMAELGCGWGCWMNNAGVAAKRRALRVHAIGVEADEGHLSFARRSLAANGFDPSEYTLHHGVAAAAPGIAWFPKQDFAGSDWGLTPVFGAQPSNPERFHSYPMVPFAQMVGDETLDLLHIDIQGGEYDLISSCCEILNERVAYLVVGTHSRTIEGAIMDTLLTAGWKLEVERAAIFDLTNARADLVVDGLQGWRNPRLQR
ncbi:class I SAM-dependent methyltransferase [Methylobacterium isbiliense]|uniref:Methyltransferase FkbM domain-containing protein n=1 Tax=Methylobacterium isbiliense TaxID=315478 RepID=A0ABQ4SQJ3_9HYPH|nr:class I SAM-dependent methyltransferase [Methylobacterium isbiliense]MDN3627941.1 class I SAM-dependent methyltransferase [Methylobacterium isbiliense]GJE04693.1 hypothetical protein GMJLKIPL_6659 [Methylobacterium isbiliense]